MINQAVELPWPAAVAVSLFVLTGACLTLIGSIGLLRFRSFYERLHAPTLGASFGMGCILMASMIFFSVLQSRLAIHEVVIGVFILLTTPVTLMLVAKAALHRDRLEKNQEIPGPVNGPVP